MHDVSVKVSKPHTIECPIEAEPQAKIDWFKDDIQINNDAQHIELLANELMFLQAKPTDAGIYFCSAQNYLGKMQSAPFSLLINFGKFNFKFRT